MSRFPPRVALLAEVASAAVRVVPLLASSGLTGAASSLTGGLSPSWVGAVSPPSPSLSVSASDTDVSTSGGGLPLRACTALAISRLWCPVPCPGTSGGPSSIQSGTLRRTTLYRSPDQLLMWYIANSNMASFTVQMHMLFTPAACSTSCRVSSGPPHDPFSEL